MGAAQIKQYNRQTFLKEHPWCVYCGEAATTTDHCPPRCTFRNREWPESYEFPACERCNHQASKDEQALAVLIRSALLNEADGQGRSSPTDQAQWEALVRGVRNNQPEILAEWMNVSPVEKKRSLRKVFGALGDEMRHAGWGVAIIGPLTHAAIERFMVKLGQALYYRHCSEIFEGVIYAQHINTLAEAAPEEMLDGILKIAPEFALPGRGKKSLTDQFIYRFNHSPEHGALYAVARFSDQFIFQLIVLRSDMAQMLEKQSTVDIVDMKARYPIVLSRRATAENAVSEEMGIGGPIDQ